MGTKTTKRQSNRIVITFDDLPYVELRANYHKSNFWAERSSSTKLARQEAYILGLSYKRFLPDFDPVQSCEIEEVFTVDNKLRRDIEGLMYGCKAFIDGLVDAGILVDDSWKHVRKLTGGIVFKKGYRKTEIIITEV